MVTRECYWKARRNADKTGIENHTLKQVADEKFRKHETIYAFGGIGSQALRFLCTLPFLELRQHDAIQELSGLVPLPLSDRSQFPAMFSTGNSHRLLREFRRLWPRLLWYVSYWGSFSSSTNLAPSSELCFRLPDILPRRRQLLLPLPSLHPLHPPIPPFFPLFLRPVAILWCKRGKFGPKQNKCMHDNCLRKSWIQHSCYANHWIAWEKVLFSTRSFFRHCLAHIFFL